MRIAVTGSSGFIGKHLVPALEDESYEVVQISRLKGYDLGNWKEVKDIAPCNVIIHLAARTFVPDSFNEPRAFYIDNHKLTVNAIELARIWGAKMIFMSSYFYGPPQYIPVDEKHSLNPHNPYAQTKYLSEEVCRAYYRDFGVDVLSFRIFNIYGPGQKDSFLIPEIISKLKSTSTFQLKDPRPKRDYIYIEDVVQAITTGVKNQSPGFHAINLGTGISTSVGDLMNHIIELCQDTISVSYTNEYRKGEVLDSVADITQLNNILKFKPQTSLKDGLKKTLISKGITLKDIYE